MLRRRKRCLANDAGLFRTEKRYLLKSLFFLFWVIGFLAPCFPQQAESVSSDDKKKFTALLKTLKAKGEFFTNESIEKTIPYQKVLFAFTEKDIADHALYPYLAVTSGMMEHQQCREYARKSFAAIQHPVLKIAWAAMLLKRDAHTPEIVRYLSQVLETPALNKWLQEMSGLTYDQTVQKIRAEKRKLKSLVTEKNNQTSLISERVRQTVSKSVSHGHTR